MPRILCANNLACCPRDWWRNLPFLSRATPTDACMCQEYSFTFTLASGGVAPFTWAISSVPEGLSFDTSTGVLSGTPVFDDTYEFTITVTDAIGNNDSRDYSLLVAPGSAAECGIEMDATAETAFDGSYVNLAWGAPTFPFADDSTYQITRNGVLIAQLTVGANTYTDTTVVSGQSYEYIITFHHGSHCPEVVYAILEEGGLGLMEEGGEAAFLEE